MTPELLCDYCLKSFSRPSTLLEHERSHTGERPDLCFFNGCDKSFARKDYLTSHLRTHSQERRHSCMKLLAGSQETPCGKAFHRKSDLMRHARRVHGQVQDRLSDPHQNQVSPSETRLDRPALYCKPCMAPMTACKSLHSAETIESPAWPARQLLYKLTPMEDVFREMFETSASGIQPM